MNRDRWLIYLAGLSRSAGVGLIGVILGLYLAEQAVNAVGIGIVIGTGLAANAVATFIVSLLGDRVGRKKTLLILSFLSSVGAIWFAISRDFVFLLLASFLGIMNGMGRDRGASSAIDQAILPTTTTNDNRTWAFAFYNVVLDLGNALGGLAALFPLFLRIQFQFSNLRSYQFGLCLYALLSFLSFLFYLGLSDKVEAALPLNLKHRRLSGDSKKTVFKLSSLFALDSLGSGFLSNALISYWFFMRFGVREEVIGPVFFVAHTANSLSHLFSAWLSKRIGIINTMVFTHIPSSLLLMIVPLAPSLSIAILFYILRECLVEMDVPVRQSYVVAVVNDEERTFASGITNLTRLLAWAVGPPFAGMVMRSLSLSAPIFMGGGIKICYDLLLFKAFRKRRPPEEITKHE